MTYRAHSLRIAAALTAAALSSCTDSKSPGKAPRVGTIPSQQANSGATFNLDLAKYVTEPSGGTPTYTVTSGGGAVSGNNYAQNFPTVGTKTVKVKAANTAGSTEFTFQVAVNTSSEAVVQAGSGLLLLNRGTVAAATAITGGILYSPEFITVSNSQGYTDTFKAALKRGHVVYERSKAGQIDLYVFNPNSPATAQLGDDPNGTTDQKFEAKTSTNHVIFTSGTATDTDLYIFNAMTGLTRTIAAVASSFERNAVVDANDIVYFESGPAAQRDIWVYDPVTDEADPVSTNAANEIIQGVVKGGGVVFSRDNGAGDVDLWFYKPGIGLTQIGADVATGSFQTDTKVFNGSTSDGKVVLTQVVSGSDHNIYYWNPADQTTTVVANSGSLEVFHGVTTNAKIIYSVRAGSDWDIHARTVGGSDVDLSGTGATDVFQSITNLNDVVFVRDTNNLMVYDDSATTLLTADAGATAITEVVYLKNGSVVYKRAGTGLRRWNIANTAVTVSVTGSFAGELDNGQDFVVKVTSGSQDDLYLWNESGGGSLDTITTNSANEAFVVSTTVGAGVVFGRANSGTTMDLYVWDATSGERQLTASGYSHSLAGTLFLDNR
ncbi:MAG: hypothetical protein H6837_11515 [Planctomycetes bacterium]|nr:hypothetical protein [Planctomycetota bacterium]